MMTTKPHTRAKSSSQPRLKPLLLALCCTSLMHIPLVSSAQVAEAASRSAQISVNQSISEQNPRIQIAVLLDTSSSMDGLIDQTRAQLWQMVDEFSTATKHGKVSRLEVAVYEYGNDGLPQLQGYLRKVSGLTMDLDRVSEALFALQTNGGSEYCGLAIDAAVRQLQWSHADQDIKAIFVAGNEAFSQGPMPFSEAIAMAKARGIKVNTIFAGDYQQGISSGWQQGALLAGGDYMNIDHNQQIAHIEAPQDKKIAELNKQLNQTYLPFGNEGRMASKRQQQQDVNSSNVSPGLLAERVKSKVSAAYKAASWDLVDALEAGSVALEDIDSESLPAPMADMNVKEQEDFIEAKANERTELKQAIARLNQQRDSYIADQRRKAKPAANTVSDAISAAIRKQGAEKAFSFN